MKETGRWLLVAALLLGASPAPRSETLSFPKDHGSHPEANIEWWYYMGHLSGGGRDYGFLLVFFRLRQFHLAHFAWTDVSSRKFRFDEKAHMGLPGIAGAKEERLDVFNEDWSAKETGAVHALSAVAADGDELALTLTPEKPPVVHGENGISRKGAGLNEYSHYVSITRFTARGTRRSAGRTEALSGTAWFDHEWGPGALPAEAAGWDWFSLQLSDGSELMLYRMRRADGSATPSSSGTFVPSRGEPRRLAWSDVRLTPEGEWRSPRSGARYPSGWDLAVPSLGLAAKIRPVLPDQELVTSKSTGVTYWEGACRIEGTRDGRPIRGRGYTELTGYGSRDVPGFARGSPGERYDFGAGVAAGLGAFVGLGGFSRVSSDTTKRAALSRFR